MARAPTHMPMATCTQDLSSRASNMAMDPTTSRLVAIACLGSPHWSLYTFFHRSGMIARCIAQDNNAVHCSCISCERGHVDKYELMLPPACPAVSQS